MCVEGRADVCWIGVGAIGDGGHDATGSRDAVSRRFVEAARYLHERIAFETFEAASSPEDQVLLVVCGPRHASLGASSRIANPHMPSQAQKTTAKAINRSIARSQRSNAETRLCEAQHSILQPCMSTLRLLLHMPTLASQTKSSVRPVRVHRAQALQAQKPQKLHHAPHRTASPPPSGSAARLHFPVSLLPHPSRQNPCVHTYRKKLPDCISVAASSTSAGPRRSKTTTARRLPPFRKFSWASIFSGNAGIQRKFFLSERGAEARKAGLTCVDRHE